MKLRFNEGDDVIVTYAKHQDQVPLIGRLVSIIVKGPFKRGELVPHPEERHRLQEPGIIKAVRTSCECHYLIEVDPETVCEVWDDQLCKPGDPPPTVEETNDEKAPIHADA